MLPATHLPIGGFLKQSLSDYPGRIASVLFTVGCNFKCSYCHNPELVIPGKLKQEQLFDNAEILSWIEKNKLLLDAVVISGGEPTLHKGLSQFIKAVKSLGPEVKLDTNGTNPEMLGYLLKEKLINYVAMDIKAPLQLDNYREIVGDQFTEVQLLNIKTSVQLLKASKIPCEFRTTLVNPCHQLKDIELMAGEIFGKYYLQEFNPQKTLSEKAKAFKPIDSNELKSFIQYYQNDDLQILLRE